VVDAGRRGRQRARHRDHAGPELSAPATLTERQLNRATLGRQLLLRREAVTVEEAVRRVVAIQAQEPASAYIALWSRVASLEPGDVDRAFRAGSIVRATLMRMTLHAVHAGDHQDLHAAMRAALRADRLSDPRFLVGGVTAETAVSLEAQVLAFATEPRTPAELEAFLGQHLDGAAPMWWALRSVAPLVHEPTGGPWSFATRRFVAPPPREVGEPPIDPVAVLARRYLEGFGPATVADIAEFTRLPRGRIREALPHAGELVELRGPGRAPLLDVPGAPPIPDESAPAAARLLPMWDSTLFAYEDRARIIPPELRRDIIRTNGDTLPTILIDGFVAGVWRLVDTGIEVTALRPIPADSWDELAGEASSLLRFLGERDPRLYSRYRRWWERLPDAVERRVLPG
jgi:hypothetical protein